MRRFPFHFAAAAALLAAVLFQVLIARDVAALAVPTLAHSRPPGPASDAAIARDHFFAHTYSRAKPVLRLPTWAAYFGSWRARLVAAGRGLDKALPDHESRRGGDAREWAAFGEALGDEWADAQGGFTRCAQASFAVETYFCGSAASTALHAPSSWLLYRPGVAALAEAVRGAHARGASLIAEVTLTDEADEEFGHHFSLRVVPGGGVKLYMSFIRKYTLGGYLTRHPAALDGAGWEAALQHLATLEGASGNWSSRAEAAYQALFDVKLEGKKAAGAIRISHAAACIVPPWDGTKADPAAVGHAESVAALLPRELQQLSLYGAGGERTF